MPNGIQKSEKICTTYKTLKGKVFYITTKENCDGYYLYKMENEKAVKIAKGSSPITLEEKYIKGK